MGNSLLQKLQKLDKSYKTAFISTFIIGLLTHLYMITNKFPNHDYPYNVHGDQFWWPLALGRWFLESATVVSTHFSLPWVNGLLSVFYVSVAAACIIGIFRVKNTVPIILCGGLLVTYPAFADTLGFIFTADGYMMALLLASAAVWCWQNLKGPRSYILPALLFGLSTGIYQAYLSFAIYLILIRIILDILEQKYTNQELLKKIGKALASGIGGMVFYYGMQLLVMKAVGSSFADYMGISDAGLPGIGTIARTLYKDTISFAELFIGSNGEFTLFEIANAVFIILLLGMYGVIVWQTKLYCRKLQAVLFVLANILLIPAAYLWDFVSADVVYRLLMLYCVVLFYLLAVVLADKYMPQWFGNAYLFFNILLLFNFGLIDNIGYYNLNLCWEQTYATAIQMQDRLQQLEGYENAEEVMIIGTLQLKNGNQRDWVMDRIPPMIGVEDVNLMRNQDFIVSILNNDLGMVLDGVNGEQREELMNNSAVKNMGCWPTADSVQMIDGVMVMKLQEIQVMN